MFVLVENARQGGMAYLNMPFLSLVGFSFK